MEQNKDSLHLLFWLVFGVAFVALMFGLTSCKTQKQVQQEYVYITNTDTLTQIKYRVDSINVHDSIVTFIKGDTIQIEKWHTKYKERLRVDTVEKVRTETLYQTRIETQIQEVNKLYWWQKTLMWMGVIAVILILYVVYKIIKKHTKP